MGQTLLQKVWDLHTVRRLPGGRTQLFIGLHLIHEVTTPQAFDMLRRQGIGVAFPERTHGTVDLIVPTLDQSRPFADDLAERMMSAFERNCREFGIAASGLDSDWQGIVHLVGPELGLTQPGMTIACGDCHTSTHGAFGAIAFGIGTSQVRALVVDVMEVDDACAVELIAREVRGPVLTALGRCNLADIELVGEIIRGAKRPRIHTFIATSHLHMRAKLRINPSPARCRGSSGGSTRGGTR